MLNARKKIRYFANSHYSLEQNTIAIAQSGFTSQKNMACRFTIRQIDGNHIK